MKKLKFIFLTFCIMLIFCFTACNATHKEAYKYAIITIDDDTFAIEITDYGINSYGSMYTLYTEKYGIMKINSNNVILVSEDMFILLDEAL